MWLERPWPGEYRPAWAQTASARSPFARAIRRRILRTLLRAAPSVFCIGSAAIDAYRELGAKPERMKLLPYFCDGGRFRNAAATDIQAVRERFGLAGKKVFLFSGQLIERKGADVLIDAFNRAAANRSDLALLVLGDGPMRQALESKAKAGVHFAGHVAQSELPAFFRAADVFVFPSRHDGWGVVLNEACAAGLPIVTTSAVGAAHDLVKDGWNGFVVPRDDAAAVAEHMLSFADRPGVLAEFGKHSLEMAERFSLQRGVEMFVECVAGT
jgi:glycosyltransferase involved in cell wall biosynthesis